MIPEGFKPEAPADNLGDERVGQGARSLGVDVHADRLGDTDRIRQLDLATFRQPGRDDILGDVAGHVGSRAVDLCGVLAAECTAAMAAHAAVGVDDDLAPGHAGIAVRPADHELARRVDVIR